MTAIPIVEVYRGVGVDDFQDRERIERVVRPEIDRVLALSDPEDLLAFARDSLRAPEARRLAADKISALREARTLSHDARAAPGAEAVRATIAGLSSLRWASAFAYCSMLDTLAPGALRPDPRPPEHAARLLAVRGR